MDAAEGNRDTMQAKNKHAFGILLVVAIAVHYSYVLFHQIRLILNNRLLHEEQRLLFPYHQITEPDLFKGDYITSFLLNGHPPALYDVLIKSWLSLGGDLVLFARVLPVVLWVLLLVLTGLAGWKLKGIPGSIGSVGLVLTQPLFLYQMTSAIPHAFAFPLLSAAILALLYGKTTELIVLTILSSVLYPIVTPIIGLSLAGHLMLKNKEHLKKYNKAVIIKILLIVGVAGFLSVGLGSSVLQLKEGFGDPLVPLQETERFPENGIGGRHFPGVTSPTLYVVAKFAVQFREWVSVEWRLALTVMYLFMAVLGYCSLTRNSTERKGLGVYLVTSLGFLVVVFILKPYYLYRFLLYPLLLALSILVPLGVAKISRDLYKNKETVYLPLAIIFFFTLIFDGVSHSKIGYQIVMNQEDSDLLEFVQSLPEQALIAGWPDHRVRGSVTEIIPYIAKRSVLVMGKAHVPSYKGYLLEMRERMNALIDAYCSWEEAPITRLKEQFDVSHLLVDKRHFAGENNEPEYFLPYSEYIHSLWVGDRKEGFFLAGPDLPGKVYESENYYVLNLDEY